MTEEVKKFVEAYNHQVKWNRDILKGEVNPDDFQYGTNDIIEHYLSTDIITEKDYELDNARVYYYTDRQPVKAELQAFNLKSLCTHYFWCVEDMAEEEYKADRLRVVNDELDRCKREQMNVLKTAKEEIESIDKLYKLLNEK